MYLIILFQFFGPKFMESRKPYELKKLLVAYNFAQVLFSAWLFYEVSSPTCYLY